MNSKEDKSEGHIIKMTSFYSNESEKTKLNWFCYELSLGFYYDIRRELREKLRKHRIYENDVAEFSIYMGKTMKNIILQKLSGRIKTTYFSYEMIESYFPMLNDDKLVNKMLNIMAKSWDEQLSFCEVCPVRCISDKDGYSHMFDEETIFE